MLATLHTCPVRVARTCMWPQSLTLHSRQRAGYALADHMQGLLVIDALVHAHGVRGSGDGVI